MKHVLHYLYQDLGVDRDFTYTPGDPVPLAQPGWVEASQQETISRLETILYAEARMDECAPQPE